MYTICSFIDFFVTDSDYLWYCYCFFSLRLYHFFKCFNKKCIQDSIILRLGRIDSFNQFINYFKYYIPNYPLTLLPLPSSIANFLFYLLFYFGFLLSEIYHRTINIFNSIYQNFKLFRKIVYFLSFDDDSHKTQ